MKRIYILGLGIVLFLFIGVVASYVENNAAKIDALKTEIALLKSGIAEQEMMTKLICEKTGISLSEYYTLWGLKSPLKEKLALREKENARKEN